MYKQTSTSDIYPKTLVIRNTKDGWIWQIYHVQAEHEAERLANNARKNGFYGITLEDYNPSFEETFTNWREEAPHIINL